MGESIKARSAPSQPCDIGRQLDGGAWTTPQKMATCLAALAVIFDGFDSQLLGVAIPAITSDWGITRADFASALASGLVGMGVGSAIGGWIGDRIGRKPALIASVLLFALGTGFIFLANGLAILVVLRLIAGLGIGGALPNATALVAEYTPLRNRSTSVIATIVCVPLGGMLAGVAAGYVLPTLGWRALFLFGGAGGVLIAILLWLWLPESPRYLVRHPQRWKELEGIMSRFGHPVDARHGFVDQVEQPKAGNGGVMAALFGKDYRRDTLALWLSFFACLTCVYMAFSWLPAMLSSQGLSLRATSAGLAFYNFGGVLGPLACVWLVASFGSRRPLLIFSVGGALSAFSIGAIDISAGGDNSVLFAGLAIHGFLVNGVQTSLYALAAHVYVTRVRASGVAAALSIGRIGAISSSFIGAWAIQAGASVYLAVLGGAMLIAFLGIASVTRQIPARS